MSSLNFKYCSKAYLLEVVKHAGIFPIEQAQQMKLPDLRAQLTALIQSHAAALAGAVASVDAMVRDGVVLKTRRGRNSDPDAAGADQAGSTPAPAHRTASAEERKAPSAADSKNDPAGEPKVVRVQRTGSRGRRRDSQAAERAAARPDPADSGAGEPDARRKPADLKPVRKHPSAGRPADEAGAETAVSVPVQPMLPGVMLAEPASETPAERPARVRRGRQPRRRPAESGIGGGASAAAALSASEPMTSADAPAAASPILSVESPSESPAELPVASPSESPVESPAELTADPAAAGRPERAPGTGQPAVRGDRRSGFRNERRGGFRQRNAERRETAGDSDAPAAGLANGTPVPVSDAPQQPPQQPGSDREPANRRDWAVPAEPGEVSAEAADPARSVRRPVVEQEVRGGVLELMPDGYGFLRAENYAQSNHDIYIPPQFIRRFNLRQGDYITGPCRSRRENDRYQALAYIYTVNGAPPEQMTRRPHFERLTPIYPDCRFNLETVKGEFATRIIDLIAPIGKGQRGMIVSPPKAGKTILLQKIANAITVNNPEAHLIVLLIDERPEEVTDMQRSINGEVVYSTFDKTPENHVAICELVLERAMRIVELGKDVVILLDSITRLARAYNLTINPTGRTLSGGLDPGALYGPKRFFGAARNIENGGSLTIVATALIDTGSRMDEVIFEEFKGTGNMEVYLDRKLSEKRIFPAIDIGRSGTRREDLLLSKDELDAIWAIRKAFGNMDAGAVTETVISLLTRTNNNHHFVSSINVSLNDKALHDTMNPKRQLGSSGGGTNGGNGNGSRY